MTTPDAPDAPDLTTEVVYRWPRARLTLMVGRIVFALGVCWLAVSVLVVFVDASAAWFAAMGAVTVLVLAATAWLVLRPPVVLEVGPDGYRVRNVRGRGTPAGRWSDVTAVSTGESVGGPVLVLEGRNAPTVVPLELLGPRATDAQDRVRAHLEAARRGPGR
jgi:hypothetical protein